MGISNKPLTGYKPLSLPFQLVPLRDSHSFLLVHSAPVHLLGRDFLEKYHTSISFFQKREIILKINSTSPSTGSIGNYSIPLKVFPLKSANKDTESLILLEKVPKGLMAKSTTDIKQTIQLPQ